MDEKTYTGPGIASPAAASTALAELLDCDVWAPHIEEEATVVFVVYTCYRLLPTLLLLL